MQEQTVNLKPELLSLILRKDFWKKYKHLILKSMFQAPLDKLYSSIEAFHDAYSEDLDKSKLWEIIKADHPTLTTAMKADIAEVVQQIKEVDSWSEEFAHKILSGLYKVEVGTLIAKAGIDLAQGRSKDVEAIKYVLDQHGANFIPKDAITEISGGLDELIRIDGNVRKWDFNLKPLQERIGGLTEGQFFMLMARPDCGKTALMASLICGPGGWAEQGALIHYFGNEEPVRRTRWRFMSAYTGLTKEQLLVNKDEANTLWEKIRKNVRTFDIPDGTPVEFIAAKARDEKPDFVLVDQVDKLSVRTIDGVQREETDRIRALYIKYRAIGKKYGAVMGGVCQASADAEGKTIVTYDQAENSKTGKAAECDAFLGVGRRPLTEDMREENYTRWITVSKNKLDKNWKGTFSCQLQPTISRYVE